MGIKKSSLQWNFLGWENLSIPSLSSFGDRVSNLLKASASVIQQLMFIFVVNSGAMITISLQFILIMMSVENSHHKVKLKQQIINKLLNEIILTSQTYSLAATFYDTNKF